MKNLKRIMNAKDTCRFFNKMQEEGVWIWDPAKKIKMKIKNTNNKFYICAIKENPENMQNCEIIISEELEDDYGFKINIQGSEITIPSFLEESIIGMDIVNDEEVKKFFKEAEKEEPKELYYANLSDHNKSLFSTIESDTEYCELPIG